MLICHSHRFHICCNECGTCDKLLRCHTCHIIHMWAFPHGQTYPSHMYLKYEVDNRLGGRLELEQLFQMWHVLHPNSLTSLTSKNMKYTHTHITPGGHLRGLGSDRRGQLHLLRLCAFWGTWMLHMARKPLWTANRWFSWQARSFFTFLLLQEVFANLKLPWEKPTFWSKYCAFLFIKCTQIKLGVFYPSILIPPSKLKEIFLFS